MNCKYCGSNKVRKIIGKGCAIPAGRILYVCINCGQGQPPQSSASSLLKHAGKWVGDDLEKCIKEIYKERKEGK